MKRPLLVLAAAALGVSVATPVLSNDRYRERPPVMVSPDLSAPWVIQLGRAPSSVKLRRQPAFGAQVQPGLREATRQYREQPVRRMQRGVLAGQGQDPIRTTAVDVRPREAVQQARLDPKFLPQQVAYSGKEKPGTIIIDGNAKFLYLVQTNGMARRYGVGVGKEGFEWSGTEKISQKKAWPEWRPPAEMIVREREKGRILPPYMDGGPANPLGARALYLGDTLYRIHGTNAPWTIGTNVSSGCIRMRNEDVTDLYERVDVGTKVVVL